MYKILIIILFLLIAVLPSGLWAQVTIGSNVEPQKGALLQLKTKDVGSQTSVTTDKDGGGLLLPRIELKNKNDLFFTSSTDPQFKNIAKSHTGLLVYNVKKTADGLDPGMCVWNGTEWINTKNDKEPEPLWFLGGNNNVDGDKHFLGTTSKNTNPLQIKTNNTNRIYIGSDGKISLGTGTGTEEASANLHVFGNMKLKDAPLTASSEVLGIHNTTNEIGRIELPIVETKAIFAQGEDYQRMPERYLPSGDTINLIDEGNVVTVTWKSSDWEESLNKGLTTFDSFENSFRFNENALCAVTGYVNYYIFSNIPDGNFIDDKNKTLATLEVAIQIYREGEWKDHSVAFAAWEWTSVNNIAQTVIIPGFTEEFKTGEKIRMVVRRQKDNLGNMIGVDHYVMRGDNRYNQIPSIGKLQGSPFSKAIKIRQIKGVEYP